MTVPEVRVNAIVRPVKAVSMRHRWAPGFTAIELMNFLALAAVLSAIGMYALARYVRHAKTVEADQLGHLARGRLGRVLQQLRRDAADGRVAARRPRHAALPAELARSRPRGRAVGPRVVAISRTSPTGRRARGASSGSRSSSRSATSTRSRPTARAPRQRRSSPPRATSTATASARRYSLAVAPDEGLTAQVAKTMTKKDVEE